jgi:uncharacterized protein (DUF1800 family)
MAASMAIGSARAQVIPPVDPPTLAAARFLEQATFGPTQSEVSRLRQVGIDAWLSEQFAMPETIVPNPGGQNMGQVQQQFLARVTTAPDQLRQRVAYALAQMLVISANKNIYPDQLVPHLQLLSRHAFGNYRNLLAELSTSSQMGKYLDLANSNKPTGSSSANENYARELLQLFSIGTQRLSADGTAQLDAQGKPVPSYDQTAVQQVALALTGWTYAGSGNNNWENFSGPLVPRDVNHDMREKRFLGCTLPAGRTAEQDMRIALDCVFQHPNLGPFVATRLIRQMVKSNPSTAYVGRVAAVFNNNGSGVRGDLRAVVQSILKDPDARNDNVVADGGRLRDPVQQVAAFLRAMGGSIATGNVLPWEFSRMAQTPLSPPSVFGFYSPLFRLPRDATLFAPEFQIYTPTEATFRANFFWRLLNSPGSDVRLDWSPFVASASDVNALIDRVDRMLLWGRMPATMRQALSTAVTAQPDARQRAIVALHLTALSGLHAIQH